MRWWWLLLCGGGKPLDNELHNHRLHVPCIFVLSEFFLEAQQYPSVYSKWEHQ